jgi:hypothetical protein
MVPSRRLAWLGNFLHTTACLRRPSAARVDELELERHALRRKVMPERNIERVVCPLLNEGKYLWELLIGSGLKINLTPAQAAPSLARDNMNKYPVLASLWPWLLKTRIGQAARESFLRAVIAALTVRPTMIHPWREMWRKALAGTPDGLRYSGRISIERPPYNR